MPPPLQAPDYKYVTEECLREWKGQSAAAFRIPDPVPMPRFLYELCWATVLGDLSPHKCRAALDSVVFAEEAWQEDSGSVLADIVAHLGQDTQVTGSVTQRFRVWPTNLVGRADLVALGSRTERGPQLGLGNGDPTPPGFCHSFRFPIYSTVVVNWVYEVRMSVAVEGKGQSLYSAAVITISGEYRNRLVKMEEFLWEVEQSKSKGQDLKAKEVRVNTRLLYQQTKFNLLREESEGYAKLVTLLCQVGSDLACQNASSATISIIKSLIGHFDLDPNRVFDIVLECFELYPDNSIFYQLIPLFPKSHAAKILGFKFQYYQQLDVNIPVPSGLFRIAALLVKSGLIDLDNLYAHLLPNDDEAFEHFGSFVSRKIDEATKIGKINLAATGKDLMDDEKQEITIDLYTALEMENDIVEERAPEIEKNQKLGLLLGFLSVHDWDHAQLLFERLAQLNPVEHIEICHGLFRIIEKTISSAYSAYCQTHHKISRNIDTHMIDASSVSSPSYLVHPPKVFFQMLAVCGPYLHRDTQLFQKVCRVLKAYHASSKESAHTTGVMSPESHIEEALGSCLLPSLQLIPANPAVDMEIWGVLSLLPYEVRYRLYGEWEKDAEQNPVVLAARQTAKLDTRRLLKRLAKENLKQLGRMVAKLAHANPMTVLRTIVQQVEAYRDMINPVVDAFKYLTQLEYDILQYIVIERLAQGGRERVKDDGLNLSDWLQCLASFWGHFKLSILYIMSNMHANDISMLMQHKELIQQMANVQYTENMTDEQVDGMAGSETLRLQSSLFGSTRNYKVLNKSTNKLRDSLLPKDEPKLAIPLLLLIAQHRSKIIINADATYIKMVAFLIYRPVMRLFKSSSSGEACWPLDGNEEGESVSCDDMTLHGDSSQKLIMWSDLLNTIRTILPTKAWNGLSPELYATFWGLTLYDLHFPKDRYDAEIKKLHDNLKQLEDNSDNSSIAISRQYEAGRLGRFLHETLKMAYYWKSDEAIYERECGNKPGFALYFRFPNSQRVPYAQFIKVHYKWSTRITKVLNQCMESKEYMEIRNALIVLTKITSIFPVIRKSGINIEKRVAKLKGDEREDLKVLATGVAAALAARKSSWLSEEEFGMGHLDLKPVPAKPIPGNQSADPSTAKDRSLRAKSTEGRHERSENAMKPDALYNKKNASTANGSDSQMQSSSAQGKVSGPARGADEPPKLLSDEGVKVLKPAAESETRAPQKRDAHNAAKVSKHDLVKEDAKPGKITSRVLNQEVSTMPADREVLSQPADGGLDTNPTSSLGGTNGNVHPAPRKVSASSQRSTVLAAHNDATANPTGEGESIELVDSTVKRQKKSVPVEEQERTGKRRKGEIEGRDDDLTEHTDKEKRMDLRSVDKFHSVDHERGNNEEQNIIRTEKLKEKFDEKYDRDHREKTDRTERRRGEDVVERPTDRSLERREHSIERMQDRGTDRVPEKGREDRNKERGKIKHAEPSIDRAHTSDERFRGQSLPPPPPLPTSFVPQSVAANRRDEDGDRRGGSTRHTQRLSPRHDEKERWHVEENVPLSQDDGKHRREEDLRDRKREDRDVSSSRVDDMDRDKGNTMKEDSDPNSASKRRKIKRDQSALEAGEYAPSAPQPPSLGAGNSQFEIRERERKGVISQHRPSHADDLPRMHAKDSISKTSRRETDQ
uniref:THO complex subunit 2 n=1 Tax=Aegilops tauschii TaxID=37682 RepID=M8C3P4_AEGTA